jgi:hypothetical protein
MEAVRDAYQDKLTLVSTMLQAAQAKGLTRAAVGKFGAAFIQDCARGGITRTAYDVDLLMSKARPMRARQPCADHRHMTLGFPEKGKAPPRRGFLTGSVTRGPNRAPRCGPA